MTVLALMFCSFIYLFQIQFLHLRMKDLKFNWISKLLHFESPLFQLTAFAIELILIPTQIRQFCSCFFTNTMFNGWKIHNATLFLFVSPLIRWNNFKSKRQTSITLNKVWTLIRNNFVKNFSSILLSAWVIIISKCRICHADSCVAGQIQKKVHITFSIWCIQAHCIEHLTRSCQQQVNSSVRCGKSFLKGDNTWQCYIHKPHYQSDPIFTFNSGRVTQMYSEIDILNTRYWRYLQKFDVK